MAAPSPTAPPPVHPAAPTFTRSHALGVRLKGAATPSQASRLPGFPCTSPRELLLHQYGKNVPQNPHLPTAWQEGAAAGRSDTPSGAFSDWLSERSVKTVLPAEGDAGDSIAGVWQAAASERRASLLGCPGLSRSCASGEKLKKGVLGGL